MLLIMIIMSTGLSALATPIKNVDIDILDFYESENMHYFDYIPEELIKLY